LSRSILNRVIETRESVLFVSDRMDTDLSPSASNSQVTACLCAPLVGQRSIIGVVQLDTCGQGSLFSRQDLDLFSVLASNAAFALERVLGA
jgi:transcriptional regulator with GAF, ATPase, and Fis domain